MDAEELKLIMRESGRIYTDANKDKYLGTTLAKNIEGLLKKETKLLHTIDRMKIEKMVDVKGFAKSIVNGREFYYLDFAS